MEKRSKKFFADSPLYSVVFSILAVLSILSVVLVFAAIIYLIQFRLIIMNAKALGPWWVILTVLHIMLLTVIVSYIFYVRERNDVRARVGDKLYFITHGATLRHALFFERTKRFLLEKLTWTSRKKSRYERFLEECREERAAFLERVKRSR
ncbi:MAG: hypothetical protein II117_01340 [Clostridia bacterium]|nr:hypothetical protein [Clostridia bacterium]